MAGLPAAAQGEQQRHAAAAAEEPKKSRKRRLSDGDGSIDNPDEDEQEKSGKGTYYKCRFCDTFFEKSQALGGHMNKHRQEREQETLRTAHALISDMQHHQTQGYMMNMYGQLSATEIAQRSSGLQARGAQFYGTPPTAAYHQSSTAVCANTFLATQHFNNMMPTNSSSNHVQQNPGDAQPSNIDNNMSSNHVPRASAFVNELTTNFYQTEMFLHDLLQSLHLSMTPTIEQFVHLHSYDIYAMYNFSNVGVMYAYSHNTAWFGCRRVFGIFVQDSSFF